MTGFYANPRNTIKSIQAGVCSVQNASSQQNTTVSAVVVANSVLHYLGVQSNSAVTTPTDQGVVLSLTSTTNVRGTRVGATGISEVDFMLVEYNQ